MVVKWVPGFYLVCFFISVLSSVAVANTTVAPLTMLATTPLGVEIEISAQGTSGAHWWLGSDGNKYYMDENGRLEPWSTASHSSLVQVEPSPAVKPKAYRTNTFGRPVQQPMLVLVLSFTDRAIQSTSIALANKIFGAQNSVAAYYREISAGGFQISPVAETQGSVDGIVQLQLPQQHPDFGGNYQQAAVSLVTRALSASADWVDYASFDTDRNGTLANDELAVVIIVAGYENAYGGDSASHPRVWAHQGELGQFEVQGKAISKYALFGELHQDHAASIGIMCHELGHLMLGLPDLYDRNGLSYGIGRWGLMGTGSWNRTGAYLGDSPAGMIAWSKIKAGFVQGEEVDQQGQYEVKPGNAIQVWLDPYQHGEHFLLEYRQLQGVDKGLPMQGLLISHVDPFRESQQNDQIGHKLVDIESADGRKDLDSKINQGDSGDPWPGIAFKREFSPLTEPSARSYYSEKLSVKMQDIRDQQTHASLYITPQSNLNGTHIGYDEAGFNGQWDSGSSVADIAQLITNDTHFDSLDGVDFYVTEKAQVNLRIYAKLVQGQPTKMLAEEKGYRVSAGWNRLLLSQPLPFQPGSSLLVETEVVSSDYEVSIAADFVGEASGRSLMKTSGNRSYEFADFDINQHLLLSDAGSVLSPGLFPSSNKVLPSSGGGIAFVFLLLLPLMLCRITHSIFGLKEVVHLD